MTLILETPDMSTEIQFEPVACPNCDAMLLPERVDDMAVLCANCRFVFVPAGRRTEQRTSRKAVISFGLGLLSLVGLFLTGIPAILLGISALRDIQRSPRALTGKPLAIGGIASGAVFGLMCGTCVGIMVAFGIAGRKSMTQTEDPQTVSEIAGRLAHFDHPRGTAPLEAMEMGLLQTRTVVYGGDPRQDHPLIVVIQLPQGSMRQQGEVQIHDQLRNEARRHRSTETLETTELELTINGQTVSVARSIVLDNERGDRFREYIAEIPNDGGLTFAGLITPEEAGAEGVALSEEEVRGFFESFQ